MGQCQEESERREEHREHKVSHEEKVVYLLEAQLLVLTKIHQGIHKMTQQFDELTASVTALKSSNDTLVALTNSIKTSLDAAIAAGTGMTPAEVQTLKDQIAAVQSTDDATVAADSPAPAPAPAPAS